jgi:hypothetical protein
VPGVLNSNIVPGVLNSNIVPGVLNSNIVPGVSELVFRIWKITFGNK